MAEDIHKRPLSDILTRSVVAVLPDTPLREATLLMARHRISCVIVADAGKPVGIITERDVVWLTTKGTSILDVPVKEVMSNPVITLAGEVDIFEAYHVLSSNRIRHIVVVSENGEMKGVVTQSDIIKSLGLDLGEIRKVSTVMTKEVFRLPPDVPFEKGLEHMARRKLSCLVLEKDGIAIGILSERDIARLIAEGHTLTDITIGEVMSSPLVTIDGEMPIHEAARLMELRRMRRLVVVGDSGSAIGIVTQTDIIKGVLEGRYIETLHSILQKKEEILAKTEKTLIEKTLFLDSILHSAKDLIVVATDPDLRIVYYNLVAESVFGFNQRSVIGKTVRQMHETAGGDHYAFDFAMQQVNEGHEYNTIIELPWQEGRKLLGIRVTSIHDYRERSHPLQGYLLMGRDITLVKREVDTLRENEEKYRSLFENSRDMVYITSYDGEIRDINEAGAHLVGEERAHLIGKNISQIYKDPEDRTRFIQIIEQENFVKDYEVELLSRNGRTIHALVTTVARRDANGNIESFQGIVRDITERKKHEEVINFLAFHDVLTGLPNRRTFHNRLESDLAHMRRHGTAGAVLFMDLDGFKDVNDTLGHETGDQLLQKAGQLIRSCLREEDMVARLGGDEFTVLLPHIVHEDDAELVAEKIVKILSQPVELNGVTVQVSVSIGISIFPKDGESADELIKKADHAMYGAKEAGKNGYKVFGKN